MMCLIRITFTGCVVLSYRVLKRRFAFDDDFLEDVKEDLIYAKQLAIDEDNRVLVWRGNAGVAPTAQSLSTASYASAWATGKRPGAR
jgi:hypothetical protein